MSQHKLATTPTSGHFGVKDIERVRRRRDLPVRYELFMNSQGIMLT